MPIYLLSNTKHEEAISLPLLQIKSLHVSLDLSKFDALIFTSKNAVYAMQQIDENWKEIPAYSIGEATSKAIQKHSGKLVYTANDSYGDAFAREISPMLRGKKVAFLRAKEIASSLEDILLNAGVFLSSFIVYESTCKPCNSSLSFPVDSVFIFTSPSSVRCFFHCYTWRESYQAVFIGAISAQAFTLKTTLHVSTTQSIDACVSLAKTLIKQN
ncbi:MAG: uroporphyrinogen-III synthase [Sulfurospirillum sp.]|nr:uroporphyrinogen-III synthase [Sulfurospirillum sp.]